MRIGLLSPHYAFNYGAVLQAFALKEFLTKQGYDAVILNRRPAYHCAIPSLYGRIARTIEEFAKYKSFGIFDRQYLQPQTESIVKNEDWHKLPTFQLDAVIVGSDQVWRDDYAFNSFGYNLFLDFIQDETLRIAYAPSLGKETWNAPEHVTAKVKELLKKFKAISVREESSIKILKDKFDVESELVVDPTLLLTSSEYLQAFKIPHTDKEYIASYILDYDSDFKNNLKSLSARLNMPLRTIGIKSPKSPTAIILNRFRPMVSVIKWVENIANAKYVVTNSFHGMVFSIIFRKQFIVVMNKERGAARFKSLLKMFGLENRLVDKSDTNYYLKLSQAINYADIEPEIKKWREKSMAYLNRVLS